MSNANISTNASANPYASQFREAYHTQFNIPEYLISNLSIYKRLNWNAMYFLGHWNSNIGTYAAGTVRRYNHIFHIQFCNGCSLGKIKQAIKENPNTQLVLSFRKSGKLPGYVLVDFMHLPL